ncbi:hypothetical protein FRC06_002578 [Ceratobasidium sp. 370]|nr:hypothetical protein FRC06_002578 [Ceratobasidium sp. 370]
MPLQHFGSEKKRFRHRVQEITLDPSTSKYTIAIKLLIDGALVHDLPGIKKSLPLCWSGPSLPWLEHTAHFVPRTALTTHASSYSDVYETSTIAIQIVGVRGKVESHIYRVSEVEGRDSWTSDRGGMGYVVKLRFPSNDMADKAYKEALAQAERMIQPSTQQKTSKLRDAFRSLLEIGSMMAGLDPSGGAKLVFTVCTKAWERLEEQSKLNDDIQRLIRDLARLAPSLELVKRFANTILKETVTDVLNLIEDVSLFILGCYPRDSRASLWSLILPSSPKDRIDAFTERFTRLRDEFQMRMIAQLIVTAEELRLAQAMATASTVETTYEIISVPLSLKSIHIGGSPVHTETGPVNTEMIRSILKPADLAGYDPARACMLGTRREIIQDIITWIQEPKTGQPIALITGLASLGKSSIATSVCQQLDEQNMLAASFFCKRDFPELSDPCQVLTTIASCLASRWEPYGHVLQAAITHARPGEYSTHIERLYGALWRRPLQMISNSQSPDRTLTIVVDALNECGSVKTRKQLIQYLWDISRAAPWLRLVLTSRPDADVQQCFTCLSPDRFTQFNLLNYDSLGDVRIFIGAQLANIKRTADGWPEDAVDQLSDHSNGLFVWARAACRVITDGDDPHNRLEQVMARTPVHFSFEPLGALYLDALKSAMNKGGNDAVDLQRLDAYYNLLRHLPPLVFLHPRHGGTDRVLHPWFMGYVIDRLVSDN